MAREEPTSRIVAASGLDVTWEDAGADGAAFPAGWNTVVLVRNSSASDITVTLDRPGLVDGEALSDRTIAVHAGDMTLIGGLDPALYAQADGNVYMDFSAVTDVQVLIIRG